MRKTLPLLASISALGIMAAPAIADTTIAPSFTTVGKLTTLRVQMDVTPNASGVFVSPSTMTVAIPKGMVLNTAVLPAVCSGLNVSDTLGCVPAGAMESNGVISATVSFDGSSSDVNETVSTQAFVAGLQGKSTAQLGFDLEGQTPFAIQQIITGTLTNGQLTLSALPDESAPGLYTATAPYSLAFNVGVTKVLKVKVKVKKKTVTKKVMTSAITAPKCPKTHKLAWSATVTYTDGSTSSTTAQSTCR
jgi:hypothetical protein